MKCAICGETIEGHGNNPWPLVKEENATCCDRCNVKVSIERIKQIKEDAMNRRDKYMRMVFRIEELASQAKRLALDLYEWDPEGACSRSVADALLDIETAYENVTGESMETPVEIVEILKEEE